MDYLDTSYVIALAVKIDVNHYKALMLEKMVREPIISSIVVAEVYTCYSRTLASILRRESLEDFEGKIEAMVEYTLRRCHARLMKADLNHVVEQVKDYAPKIPLKMLDLLHLLVAKALKATRIVTLDSNLHRKGKQIRGLLGLDVLTVEEASGALRSL